MKKQRKMDIKRTIVFCSILSYLLIMPASTYAANKHTVEMDAEDSVVTGDTSGISIDGYFDDWEDKPMSVLTWNNNNGNAFHDVSLIKDEEFIYIYLGMHPSYHSELPVNAIYLSINNQECQLFVRYANDKNTVDWSREVKLNHAGTYLDLHPFTYYPDNALGDAAATIYNGNTRDQLEIRISIKELEKVMGLKEGTINTGSQIKLRMPNVGGGTIELVGTSTGTIIGIALCIGTVVYFRWRRINKARIL